MARRNVVVLGADKVIARLDHQLATSSGRARQAVEAMGKRGAELSRRRTPIESGKLRKSYRVSTERRKTGARGVLANVAEYAARVHENVEEKLRGVPRPGNRPGRYWDGGESKFLEKGVYENKGDLLRAALNGARISKLRG